LFLSGLPWGRTSRGERRGRRTSSPRSRFHAGGWIGATPLLVCRRSIDRWHGPVEHAEIHRQLRAMVRGVENSPPKDPDALPLDIEEGGWREPPGLVAICQVSEARAGEFRETIGE